MKPNPAALVAAFLSLAGLSACNRPATELIPASVLQKATTSHGDTSAEDALISSQVKLALEASEDINGEDISVATRQGKVVLTGTVPARQIARAEEVARNVDGVRDVYNRLKPIGVMA